MSSAPQPTLTPEFAAGLREFICAGLEREYPTTARVIAAVPDAKRDYKPDPKAKSAFDLAWHIASTDVYILEGVAAQNFEPLYEKEKNADKLRPANIGEIVKWYEKNMKAAIAAVRAMKPQQLTIVLNFFGAFNLPSVFYLSFAQSHGIHHRGQLSTYLRPMGSKIPSIYGGSADEPFNP